MIEIQGLSLSQGNQCLFSDLNLKVGAGQVVVVLGPNGAGKSTLLLTLAGMHDYTQGSIAIQGQALRAYARHTLAELIGWQGDLPQTEFGLTVCQRLKLAAGSEQTELDDALEAMGLLALQGRPLGQLSAGERQRTEIAALMAADAPIWLMDEPTAHLDLRHQADCLRLMKAQARQGKRIVTVLHDLQQAVSVADVVVLLDGQGGVAQAGDAGAMLKAEILEPVFGVKLTGDGSSLKPVYE